MNEHGEPTILIVDDNPKNLQYLGNLLTDAGYEPVAVLDGEQAFEFLDTTLPDLILLDIMMPEMDGFEICKKIKETRNACHIPIIFLTAKTAAEDIVKGFELGGSDYVTKPFQPAELLVRVKTQIEMKILRGLIPICSKCKSIRDDKGFWQQLERYLENHSQAMLSHGLCPPCSKELYGHYSWFNEVAEE